MKQVSKTVFSQPTVKQEKIQTAGSLLSVCLRVSVLLSRCVEKFPRRNFLQMPMLIYRFRPA